MILNHSEKVGNFFVLYTSYEDVYGQLYITFKWKRSFMLWLMLHTKMFLLPDIFLTRDLYNVNI